MNNLKSYSLTLIALLFCITSCSKDSNDSSSPQSNVIIKLSQESITCNAVGGSYTIDVETTGKEWTATSSNTEIATARAIGTTTTKGTIEVKVSKNPSDAERTTTIIVKSGTARKNINVVQAAPFAVSPVSLFFNTEGGSQTVTVSSSDSWTAKISDAWITCEKDGGSLKVTATANNGDYRTGKITISTGMESAEVEVKQDGNSEIKSPIEGYHLVWNDEFSTGSELDSKNWVHEVQRDHWVNNELQNYVNGKSPAGKRVTEIKEGHLLINCFKENGKIYSGRVYGNKSKGWQYGYVEARIKLPSGKGTWPAFWMMPVNFKFWPHDGEIDIMEEVGYRKDYVSSSLHADGHVHSNNTQITKETYCKGAEGEFHVYGMEWTKDHFQFYVDGKKTLYYKNPGTGVVDWPYDAPFYVIFNLAWGGDWGGQQGTDESALPVTMEVDYVRVFQK